MKKSIIIFILGLAVGFGAKWLLDVCCKDSCKAEGEATESLVAMVADGPNIDIASLPVDAEGFITLFGLPLKVRAMKMMEAEKNHK